MKTWTSENSLKYSDMNRIETDLWIVYKKIIAHDFKLPELKFITNRADSGAIDSATTTRLSYGIDNGNGTLAYTVVQGGYNNIEYNIYTLAHALNLSYKKKDFSAQTISFVDINRWERMINLISQNIIYPWMVAGVGTYGDGHRFGGDTIG